MNKIISFIQVKGGAGKSTIATNIAGMIAMNKKVALIDCDLPQATSASWAAVRDDDITTVTASNHVELIEHIDQLQDSHDFIIVDAPPRIAEITKAAIIMSDLCLVPLGASAPEIWSTVDLLETVQAAKERKQDIDVRIIWNKYRASTKSAKELSTQATEQLQLDTLETKLGYRVAYSEAIGRGMTVLEWTDRKAKDELKALGNELQKVLKVKFMGGI